MITTDEAGQRVAKGAAYLDRVRLGWFNAIDTGRLTLHRGCACVVGQLCGGAFDVFKLGLDHDGFSLRPEDSAKHDLVTHGFALSIWAGELARDASDAERVRAYQPLQDAWIAAIADRKLAPARQPASAHADATDAVRLTMDQPVVTIREVISI